MLLVNEELEEILVPPITYPHLPLAPSPKPGNTLHMSGRRAAWSTFWCWVCSYCKETLEHHSIALSTRVSWIQVESSKNNKMTNPVNSECSKREENSGQNNKEAPKGKINGVQKGKQNAIASSQRPDHLCLKCIAELCKDARAEKTKAKAKHTRTTTRRPSRD